MQVEDTMQTPVSQLPEMNITPTAGPAVVAVDRSGVVRSDRTALLKSAAGLVEHLRCDGAPQSKPPEEFSPKFQICLPYRGLFIWHVGDDHVVADANQVLFVSGGESYRVSRPRSDGYAEVIITPACGVLAEVANASEAHLRFHPLFERRSRRADLDLQRLRARILHRAAGVDWEGMAGEELVMTLLRSALVADNAGRGSGLRTRRLIGRTKEFLEANFSSPIRLADVARAVSASPAYLTDVFRRVEGVPLHRYVMELRLGRALLELPHTTDLTTLAFDLGFSSHSHFAAAFRRAFGCTPSQFRKSTHNENGVPDSLAAVSSQREA
jgi:AraC family transcriptional regulator